MWYDSGSSVRIGDDEVGNVSERVRVGYGEGGEEVETGRGKPGPRGK